MAVKIHFLNVGGGDCTIICLPSRTLTDSSGNQTEIPERITMIDFNHSEDHEEYENIIGYYKENFGNKSIFRFITTHPHHDHICGLHKLFGDSDIDVVNYWDVPHKFKPESFDGHDWHEEDWKIYENIRNTTTKNPTTLNYTQGDERKPFWDGNNDNITILSPSKNLLKYGHNSGDGTARGSDKVEIDDISYALMLGFNGVKIVFGGDGREKAWDDIMSHSSHIIKDSKIFKAPHHGVQSAFHEPSVKHINPSFVIFSNDANSDYENGAEDLYNKHVPSAAVLKTSDFGTIIATIDFDGTIQFHNKNGSRLI